MLRALKVSSCMSDDTNAFRSERDLVVRRWLEVADRDIRAAEACLDRVPEAAAFHCQQAAEKLIKGLLVLAQVPFRKTHDLEALRDLAAAQFGDLAAEIDRLVPLTDWGHVFRYPDIGDNEPVPSPTDLSHALADLRRMATLIMARID
jgi:HEPN domain-containing protein